MPRKKRGKQRSAVGDGLASDPSPTSTPVPPTQLGPSPEAGKTSSTVPSEASLPSLVSSLTSCRYKHLRYSTSFGGGWIQMRSEVLETIANINYNTPRPRPIDPAVLFDMVKIRKNVDEASSLAVGAASDTVTSTSSGARGHASGRYPMDSRGSGSGGHGFKLSRERKFRMRELATQKLAHAYRLDETACSVAVMQGAPSLQNISDLVLRRNSTHPDARYVHFFHEKISSEQLAESTSLEPLQDTMSGQPEVLRTQATAKMFKCDSNGAIEDLSAAIASSKFRGWSHPHAACNVQGRQSQGSGARLPYVILSEDDQPSGLESQLLFQRGCVYLTAAFLYIPDALTPQPKAEDGADDALAPGGSEENTNGGAKQCPEAAPEGGCTQADFRWFVKTMAKRALRDFMAFISRFEYTPDLPLEFIKEFSARVLLAFRSTRNHRCSKANGPTPPHAVFALDTLFSAVPPSNLPEFPSKDFLQKGADDSRTGDTREVVTFHPLLTEALHCLLLCHCLVQTSAAEIRRHAYMVARLVRICDGSPAFVPGFSPARDDWVDVLRRTNNWLGLGAPWSTLCFPAQLLACDSAPQPESTGSNTAGASTAVASDNDTPAAVRGEERRLWRREEEAAVAKTQKSEYTDTEDKADIDAAMDAAKRSGHESLPCQSAIDSPERQMTGSMDSPVS